MKKRLLFLASLLLLLLAIISFMAGPKAKFYYAFTEKRPLIDHPSKIIVRFRDPSARTTFQSALKTLDNGGTQRWPDKRTMILDPSDLSKRQDMLDRFARDTSVASVHPIVVIDGKIEAGITDDFVVQFNDNVSKATIDSLNKVYGVSVVSNSLFHILRVSPRADALEIANKYQETGLVKFSHPDFISAPEFFHVPNDPYFAMQYNLNNTGQVINDGHTGTPGADIKAVPAWDITQGSASVIIAVLDQGLTSNHPDLPNTRQIRLAGSNFGDGNANDPSPVTDHNHGNACAGIAAATMDNNEGIAGICPNCTVMPIRLDNTDNSGLPTSAFASAFNLAVSNGASVISNSYGWPTANSNLYPDIVTAIQNAVTNGRGGLGCVVAFAAGNYDPQSIGVVAFPACVNINGVLAVGASDRYDMQAQYSPPGNTAGTHQVVDVVAPSHRAYPDQIAGETLEIWSIDMPGLASGYNSYPAGTATDPFVHPPATGETLPSTGTNFDSYTGRMGGTSAACPQVAALAALVLSVNPAMTQYNVYVQLIYNADKIGGYAYSGGKSTQVGYGRINACATVVSSLAISGPANMCASAQTYTIPNLPAGAGVTWSATSNPAGGVSLAGSGSSVTVTKISDCQITLGAAVTNTCYGGGSGTFTIGKNITVGAPAPSLSTSAANNCYYNIISTVPAGSTGIQYSSNNSTWNNASILYSSTLGYYALIAGSVEGPVTEHIYMRSINVCGTGGSVLQTVTVPAPKKGSCGLVVTNVYNFAIYPNPSQGQVTISAPAVDAADPVSKLPQSHNQPSIRMINVYTRDGKLMRHFEYGSPVSQTTISLGNLSPGNYLIEIGDATFSTTQNLLIVH